MPFQLCGSTFGRRNIWRCKKIKERKRRDSREEGTGREEESQEAEEEWRK
jgi:hypothetical protein